MIEVIKNCSSCAVKRKHQIKRCKTCGADMKNYSMKKKTIEQLVGLEEYLIDNLPDASIVHIRRLFGITYNESVNYYKNWRKQFMSSDIKINSIEYYENQLDLIVFLLNSTNDDDVQQYLCSQYDNIYKKYDKLIMKRGDINEKKYTSTTMDWI